LFKFFSGFGDKIFLLEELFFEGFELILKLDHILFFFLEGVELFFEFFQLKVPPFIAFFELCELIGEMMNLCLKSSFLVLEMLKFLGFSIFEIFKLGLKL
jgi:hypothetical protein